MKLNISHVTTYRFETPPIYGLQQVRLSPKETNGQRVKDWALQFEGAVLQTEFVDHHNNKTHLIRINEGISELRIKSQGTIAATDTYGVIGRHGGYAPLWYFLRQTLLTQAGPEVVKLSKAFASSEGTELERLHELSYRIGAVVSYQTGQTTAFSTAEDAIKAGAGVCQDHTHIFTSAVREAGLPARYVSGYLMMNDRVDQDATHAWAEVHLPDLGWTGFDVSNQISPDARYVRVATGLDYSSAAPISGLTQGGSGETISVDVQVQQ